MKATEAKLLDFLKKSPQFVIPIYQRTYSWTEPECRQLWDDILRSGRDDRINAHFVGSIVYIEKGLYQVSSQSPMLVIDGQQRLTTVSLILEALARKLGHGAEPVDGFSAKKLRSYYLLNPLEEGERGYKLILTQTDKQTLLSLLEQKSLPKRHSLRLKDNFAFFEKQVATLGDDLAPLCKGLAKLMVVDISLSRDQDNPQLIFESMNSTGRELYARSAKAAAAGIDALIADVHAFAGYYCAMALGRETNPALAAAFADLRELKVDVAYPLLLQLYRDYEVGNLSSEEFAQAVRWVESYVFRRAVCAIPTNSMNKTFATFGKAPRQDRYLESIQAHFLLLPSYRRFPGDEEFRRELKQRDLYNFRSRSYWLRRLENHGRKERVPVDEYTIEHIMPQNEDLSAEWQKSLGEDWERVRDTWLHTLGNLTLTGYNSEYSDHPFSKKRDMQGGFGESPLRLNEGLGQLEGWNEAEIRNRAERLAQKASGVWSAPHLEVDVLDEHRPKKAEKRTAYTIEDHPHLLHGRVVPQLFESFRQQVLALDPCVTEEFLKLYVAYKAETNFVDVVPQAKHLRLSINLDFHELYDPRGMAKDVTNLGRWGNGNVEVPLALQDDIPYVMGLVRQAFEKQMGNGEVEA